ncbi:hypothetical protein CHLRE_02g095072v5 [Chlamydomonas reinhardtii]|uniref:Flagellar associated protein n=1 Tax=Chlamydomonas reinhardtii TaxID=3055 RepID=A8JG37_CHLRE|nr:uncharacterized protein CHLRE_02g095072v5 [Chlamydomonas reinhardtii]ACJ06133.1 flagellar associated protein [Chlamydomonas reinhardtii]PNW86685.1 hypothetical protein CHLRE_02g095072v5 [Chlamydomonas reinhardtii]8GLV_zr Chain zr, Flagellar associated protein [Chlamydomonas reinhardtii]8GLV_zs Chain zs, Flagellar associated protein [Chlamydomonas reinhardtii]|eukprot:XP_001702154.1 flagellar associated protein [Chlamydomonas reinhardtii]
MSMVAGKMDAVSVNRVWEEHVKKEAKTLKLNDQFCITDPRKMDVLPEKPNRTVPTQNPDASTIAAATQTLHNLAAAKDVDKLPVDRYALPVTGNMEYGFFHRVQNQNTNPMFDHKHNVCDVTEYAQEYVKSNGGVGPYTTKLNH